MQNSNNIKYLQNKLTMVEDLTDKITNYINKSSANEKYYIKNLDSLYMSRKKELTELKRLITSFNNLIDDSFSKRVENLIAKDKENLNKLNKKIELIRENLRKLNNKKSLLLYR